MQYCDITCSTGEEVQPGDAEVLCTVPVWVRRRRTEPTDTGERTGQVTSQTNKHVVVFVKTPFYTHL